VAKLESSEPYRGTVTIAIEDHEIVMGTQVASRVWVRDGKAASAPA